MTSATAAPAARPARGNGARGTGPLASVAEYFTLQRAAEISTKLPQDARTAISDALTLGRQKSDAADALWTNGHTAEGLRLAGEALEATLKVAPTYVTAMGLAPAAPVAPAAEGEDGEASAEPEPAAPADERDLRAIALRARGADERDLASLEAAVSAFRGATLPLYDAQISPAHGDLYQQVTSARHALDRRFATAPMVKRQIVATRIGRIGTAALLTIGTLVAVHLLTRQPEYTVHASAVWADAPAYDEQKALDGRTDTWWLVPDGQQGWLEVRFTSPHDIQRVRLLNTANAPHMDRGTNEYRVELYGTNGEIVRTIEGQFEHRNDPQWVEHAVGLDGIARIRFVVESHHRTSAGLTELEWE